MVFWGLVFTLVLFASLYMFLINKTVLNVAAAQRMEKTMANLGSQTGEMEATYMTLKNSIDLNLATSLGFSPTKNTKYINRTTLGRLSSNSVE